MVFYFRKGTKKAVTKFVTAFLWTSLGLNQGPPDYESVALYGGCLKIEKLDRHTYNL